MTPAEIPTVDLRVSEFSPDRDRAMRTWAYNELQRQREESEAIAKRRDEFYARQVAAAAEERALLRIEAVKRGEVWHPPVPRALRAATPGNVYASTSFYATGAYYR